MRFIYLFMFLFLLLFVRLGFLSFFLLFNSVFQKRQQVRRGTFKEQVIQKDFWLVIAFLAVQSLRVAMYVGTLNDRFASGISRSPSPFLPIPSRSNNFQR